MTDALPTRGAVFWPVGTGDSTTLVIREEHVMQIDPHDMAKADSDSSPERPVVDELAASLPIRDGRPYLAVFALTHADKDHCLGFADLLKKVTIGELWATPRLWREYLDGAEDDLCEDARAFQEEAERRVAAVLADVADGKEPASGDRIMVFGYDTDHDKHAYNAVSAAPPRRRPPALG
jgi:ribonuclease BN (tRNA processing enzyme)